MPDKKPVNFILKKGNKINLDATSIIALIFHDVITCTIRVPLFSLVNADLYKRLFHVLLANVDKSPSVYGLQVTYFPCFKTVVDLSAHALTYSLVRNSSKYLSTTNKIKNVQIENRNFFLVVQFTHFL